MKEKIESWYPHYENNRYGLNTALAKYQGLNQEDFNSLISLYDIAHDIIKEIETETVPENFPKLLDKLSQAEFDIQEGWGFNRDSTMHYFSFTPKNCTCPKLDNMELKGFDRRIYNMCCPIHSSRMKVTSTKNDNIL